MEESRQDCLYEYLKEVVQSEKISDGVFEEIAVQIPERISGIFSEETIGRICKIIFVWISKGFLVENSTAIFDWLS